MFPHTSFSLILIGCTIISLVHFMYQAEASPTRPRPFDESDMGLPRSIGKPKKSPTTKAPLPFNVTPDPNFKIHIGPRMGEILQTHNETFDEFDNKYYEDYDNEFARGAQRYNNFEQKDRHFQELLLSTKNHTKA